MPLRIGEPIPRKFVVNILAYAAGGFALVSSFTAWGGMHGWTLPIIMLVCALLFLALPNIGPRQTEFVEIDDGGVSVETNEGIDRVEWQALERVRILTTSGGPWSEDVFFILETVDGKGCAVPHDAAVRTRLLEEIQSRLKDVRDDKVIEAMGCTADKSFTIWEKNSAGAF